LEPNGWNQPMVGRRQRRRDGVVVYGLDAGQQLPGDGIDRAIRLVDVPLPGEDNIIRREWLAIAPRYPLQQVEGHRGEVRRQQSVLDRRHFLDQYWHQGGVGAVGQQWLRNDHGGSDVLAAGGIVGAESRGTLRHEDAQIATFAPGLVRGAFIRPTARRDCHR
jgi:hypothetical protein